jgi:hypothetical protein
VWSIFLVASSLFPPTRDAEDVIRAHIGQSAKHSDARIVELVTFTASSGNPHRTDCRHSTSTRGRPRSRREGIFGLPGNTEKVSDLKPRSEACQSL